MFHFNFFKGNRYPYITHSSPNKEHDGLHVARAAQTINSKTLKTELTEAGNESLALEGLARQQGFDTSQQHTAYHDAFTSLKILRIVKDKHKENWENFLSTSTKNSVETILKSEGIYSIFENVKGRNMMYLVSTIHPEHCFHPAYASWGYLWDLRRDPEPLLNLSVNDLKVYLKKFSPKALRVIKTNKAPVVLDKKFALKEKAYSDLDLETIQKRARLVRSSENFCKNIQIINREAAEEKAQTQTQEDLLPEETLYEKFIPNKDTALFKTWHSSSWEDKLRMLDKFQDKRCSWFGQKIIYQEAPHILPPDLYKNIKSEIARRILSKNREKWQTVGMAYQEIDTLRDQASNRDDEEELKKLDEINEFIMSLEKKYEIA
jgi:exodeoxyribonuclease-1